MKWAFPEESIKLSHSETTKLYTGEGIFKFGSIILYITSYKQTYKF